MIRLVPGLGLAALATAALLAVAPAVGRAGGPAVSPMVLALLLGATVGSVLGRFSRRPGRARALLVATAPGIDVATRHVLRAGVVLLGLQLSMTDVVALGWRGLAVVGITVAVTFGATLGLGHRLGVPRDASLLVATGFSICGAAAVSAMTCVLQRRPGTPTGDRRRDDVATALALVTVYGSLAVVTLPWLAGLLGLTEREAGIWAGASVQEVAQVVAAAGAVSTTALATATVAKLARVALLAPLVTGTSAVLARRSAPVAQVPVGGTPRPAPVPGFVLGFLGAVVLRSLGVVPEAVLGATAHVTVALFVAAMFALGLGVDVPRLVRTGRRPLLLGAASAVVVTTTALAAVLVLRP